MNSDLPQVSGYALFQHAAARSTVVPWLAQAPGMAVERVLPPSEGWQGLSRHETQIVSSLNGEALPAERLHSLSFYAFIRPGQCVGLVLDPFLLHRDDGPYPSRLVRWGSLHPDKRRFLLNKAFNSAVVAPTPIAFLTKVRERCSHDPSPDVRAIWQARSSPLLRHLTVHPAVSETERDTLRTMTALGAFE